MARAAVLSRSRRAVSSVQSTSGRIGPSAPEHGNSAAPSSTRSCRWLGRPCTLRSPPAAHRRTGPRGRPAGRHRVADPGGRPAHRPATGELTRYRRPSLSVNLRALTGSAIHPPRCRQRCDRYRACSSPHLARRTTTGVSATPVNVHGQRTSDGGRAGPVTLLGGKIGKSVVAGVGQPRPGCAGVSGSS